MDENIIKKNLKSFKPKPDRNWQKISMNIIRSMDENVTTNPKNRNSIVSVFNFLKTPIMSTKLNAVVSIVSIVATLTAGIGTVAASNEATPGDFLYPVDKAVESVRRSLVSDPLKKAEFEIAVMDERVLELEKLSEENDSEEITSSIAEIEVQQLRLRERLQEMNQLRTENKIQTQEQMQVMTKLQLSVQENEASMNQTQTKLHSQGDSSNSDSVTQLKNSYSGEMGSQMKNFEEETGLRIQTSQSEQNQAEDTQIQNQNQAGTQNGDGIGDPNTQESGSDLTPSQKGKN